MTDQQFDTLLSTLNEMKADLRAHYTADAQVWAIVHSHVGVIRAVKYVGSTLIGVLGLTWLFNK